MRKPPAKNCFVISSALATSCVAQSIRTNISPERRGRIMIINAVNKVTRRNAQSWLDDVHIRKIADACAVYENVDGFASIITIADAAANNYSFSIPLYVREVESAEAADGRTVDECISAWRESSFEFRQAFAELKSMWDAVEGGSDGQG